MSRHNYPSFLGILSVFFFFLIPLTTVDFFFFFKDTIDRLRVHGVLVCFIFTLGSFAWARCQICLSGIQFSFNTWVHEASSLVLIISFFYTTFRFHLPDELLMWIWTCLHDDGFLALKGIWLGCFVYGKYFMCCYSSFSCLSSFWMHYIHVQLAGEVEYKGAPGGHNLFNWTI